MGCVNDDAVPACVGETQSLMQPVALLMTLGFAE